MPNDDVLAALGLAPAPKPKSKKAKAKAKSADDKPKAKTATTRELPRNERGQFVSPSRYSESGEPTNPDSTDRPRPETFGESWSSFRDAGTGQLNGGGLGGRAAEVLANLGFSMVPGVGLVNTVSGLLGGPTVGGALRSAVDPVAAPVASSTRAQIGNAPAPAAPPATGTSANIPATPAIHSPSVAPAPTSPQQSTSLPAPPETRNVALQPAETVSKPAETVSPPTALAALGLEPVYPDMSTAVFGNWPTETPDLEGMAGQLENEIEAGYGYPNGPRGPMPTFGPMPPERPIGLEAQLPSAPMPVADPMTPAAYAPEAAPSVQNPTDQSGLEHARAISAAEFSDRFAGEMSPESIAAGMGAPNPAPLDGIQSVDQSGISARHQGEFGGKQFTGESPIPGPAMPQPEAQPYQATGVLNDAVMNHVSFDDPAMQEQRAMQEASYQPASMTTGSVAPFGGRQASAPQAPIGDDWSMVGERGMVLDQNDVDKIGRMVRAELDQLAPAHARKAGISLDEARMDLAPHVIDSITNRAAAEHRGKNVIDVMEARQQYSPVNGPKTTKDLPAAGPWGAYVSSYLSDRAMGKPARYDEATHYANTTKSSATSKSWRDKYDVLDVFGNQKGYNKVGHTVYDDPTIDVPEYNISLDYVTPEMERAWQNPEEASWATEPNMFGSSFFGLPDGYERTYDQDAMQTIGPVNDVFDMGWDGSALGDAMQGVDPMAGMGGYEYGGEGTGGGYFDGGSGYDTPSESTGRGTDTTSNTGSTGGEGSYASGGSGYDTPSEGTGRGSRDTPEGWGGSGNAGQDAVDAARAEAEAAAAQGYDSYSDGNYY